VAGLFLNAYALAFDGDVEMWRLPRGEHDVKRDLEDEFGLALWGERDAFWAAHEPTGVATPVLLSAANPRRRVLFAAREAIVASAERAGHEAWFGRGGEMNCLGILPAQQVDRFDLQPQLVMRLVQEDYIDAEAAILVRAKTRWRCSGSLADGDVHGIAVGERAIRLRGDGPRAGVVEAVGGTRLQLRIGSETVRANPEDYALVTGSRLVAAWRGSEILRELQIASGVLTISNRRNRYAIQERFRMAGQMLRSLEWPLPLPGGGNIKLEDSIRIHREDQP
jgi:hypothetical protein